MCICAHLQVPALCPGTGRLLDAEASLILSAWQRIRAAVPGHFPWCLGVCGAASVAGRHLFESILSLQLRKASLQSVPRCPGYPRGCGVGGGCRGAGHQAVNREGGPGLDHVNPPDGDQEAQGPAGLLGVQREVTQDVVGSAKSRWVWGHVGQTDFVHKLQRHQMKWKVEDRAQDTVETEQQWRKHHLTLVLNVTEQLQKTFSSLDFRTLHILHKTSTNWMLHKELLFVVTRNVIRDSLNPWDRGTSAEQRLLWLELTITRWRHRISEFEQKYLRLNQHWLESASELIVEITWQQPGPRGYRCDTLPCSTADCGWRWAHQCFSLFHITRQAASQPEEQEHRLETTNTFPAEVLWLKTNVWIFPHLQMEWGNGHIPGKSAWAESSPNPKFIKPTFCGLPESPRKTNREINSTGIFPINIHLGNTNWIWCESAQSCSVVNNSYWLICPLSMYLFYLLFVFLCMTGLWEEQVDL